MSNNLNKIDVTGDSLVISIKDLLEHGSYAEALRTVKSVEFNDSLTCTGELISVVTNCINSTRTLVNPALTSCENILCEIAKNAMPEETFFELLDKIDGQACDVLVMTLLQPFDIVLHRLTTRRVQSLEWFYSSLIDNLKEIDLSDEKRICYVFNKIDAFTTNYINELNSCDICVDSGTLDSQFFAGNKCKGQEVIANFLLNGLALLAAFETPDLLVTVVKNLGNTLPSLDIPLLQYISKSDLNNKVEVPAFAYQMLYYMVFCQGVESNKFPLVYSHEFIFECAISLSCGLMEHEDAAMHEKGLSLLKTSMEQIRPHSIPHICLSSPIHCKLFLALSKVMVFNPSKEIRQNAVPLLRSYIETFDPKGRHLFLIHAINISNQQGVIAYLITLIKEFFLEYVNKGDKNYFRANLPQLLCAACQLPKVKNTALFDASDQAITALSLIRFFYMKDPEPGNLGTGIWELESKLKTRFLEPISEMLEKSRNSLKQQLHDAQCLRTTKSDSQKPQLSVDVQGSLLPLPKYEEEIVGLKAKLNTLDLIAMRLEIAIEDWGR